MVTLFDFLHRPENFTLKSLAYGGFGVSLVIPLSHAFINEYFYHNYGDSFTMASSIPEYLLVGSSYLFGLYVYTVRCPERHYPGRFNVCGQSHQIWHCFVVSGILFTYMAVLENFETRKISVCPAVPFVVWSQQTILIKNILISIINIPTFLFEDAVTLKHSNVFILARLHFLHFLSWSWWNPNLLMLICSNCRYLRSVSLTPFFMIFIPPWRRIAFIAHIAFYSVISSLFWGLH